MTAEPQAELETLRALLAQARSDRDALQARVHTLEGYVHLMRRIPGLTQVDRARRRVMGRRGRPASPPPPSAALRPGTYLDVSVLREGVWTGIPRVAVEWGRHLPVDFVSMRDGHLVHDVEFIPDIRGREPDAGESARAGLALAGGPGVTLLDPAIPLGPGFEAWQERIRELRHDGGRYVPLVHDLLPLQFPDFFDGGMRERFPRWLSFVSENADVILAVSDATADSLRRFTTDLPPVVTCRSGSDSLPEPRRQPDRRDGFSILMVGTVEPRKAVDVAVNAIGYLRERRGLDVNLTLIGHAGWADPALIERLADLDHEPWFEWRRDADDQTLADAYASADLLLATSRGEGYGLPLVEARAFGLPTLARDIPPFREALAGDGAFFRTDAELPQAIERAMEQRPICTPGLTRSWDAAVADVSTALANLGVTPSERDSL